MSTEHLFFLIFESLKCHHFPLIKTLALVLMFSMDRDMLPHLVEKVTHTHTRTHSLPAFVYNNKAPMIFSTCEK